MPDAHPADFPAEFPTEQGRNGSFMSRIGAFMLFFLFQTVLKSFGWGKSEPREVLPAKRPYAAWLENATTPGRPWELERWGAVPLDAEGIAYRLPRFLSVEECEHIINEVSPRAGFHMQTQTRVHRSTPLVGANLLEPSWTERHKDALNWTAMRAAKYDELGEEPQPVEGPDRTLSRVEKRIAKLTGLPFHDVESPLMLGVTSSGKLSAEEMEEHHEAKDFFVRGLHHDHNQRNHRTVTVLVYLSAEENGVVGGGTLFPCLRPLRGQVDVDEEPPEPPEVCNELTRFYKQSKLAVQFHQETSSWFSSPDDDGSGAEKMSRELTQRVRAQCGDELDASAGPPPTYDDGYGLLVRPLQQGDALLFLSVAPEDGVVNRQAWHTGCPVHGESTDKYTLQKFKEVYRAGQIDDQGMIAGEAAKIKASAGSCKANLPPKPLQIEEEAPKAEADVEVIDFDGPDM